MSVKITGNQRDVLEALYLSRKDWSTPSDLGGHRDSHHSNTLKALVQRGLVRHKSRGAPDPAPGENGANLSGARGSKCYQLTDAGRSAWDDQFPPMEITGEDRDAELFRTLFDYNPETGSLVWAKTTAYRMNAGDPAGCTVKRNGKLYRYVRVCGRNVMAHRIIWAIVHGRYPSRYVDHINGDGLDNRLSNLRECTHMENAQNRIWKPGKGLLGAHKGANGRWTSSIRANGKQIRLGSFASSEEAHLAYCEAKKLLHTFSPTIRTTEGSV